MEEFICNIKPKIKGKIRCCPECWDKGLPPINKPQKITILKQGQYLCPYHTREWKEKQADKKVKAIVKKKKGGRPRKWNEWEKRILDITHDKEYQRLIEIAFNSSIDSIQASKKAMIRAKNYGSEIFFKEDKDGKSIVHPENDLIIKSLIKGYKWVIAEKVIEFNDIKSLASDNVLMMAITVEVQSLMDEYRRLSYEGKELESVDKEELDRLLKIQREVEQEKQDKKHIFEVNRNTNKTILEEMGEHNKDIIEGESLETYDTTRETDEKAELGVEYEIDKLISSELEINHKKDKNERGDDTIPCKTMDELNKEYGTTHKDNEQMIKDKRKARYPHNYAKYRRRKNES